MIKPLLLLATLILLGMAHVSAAAAFAPGQVWAYATRPSEPQSRVAVLRIDTYPKIGRIVHIAVIDLRLRRTPDGPEETWQIGQLRITEKALRKSVTALDPATPAPVIPGFEENYQKWKTAADRGDVQRWQSPVRDIVEQMEKWVHEGKS